MDFRLRNDPRIRLMEKTNARYLTPDDLAQNDLEDTIAFIAVDVSFISATLVLRPVVEAMRGTLTEAVVLVKPQFEAGREHVGKGGIVRDPAAHALAVERVRAAVAGLGGEEIDVIDSPVLGAEGNREFLLHARWS